MWDDTTTVGDIGLMGFALLRRRRTIANGPRTAFVLTLLVVLSGSVPVLSAASIVVVNDPFSDGDRSKGADPLDIPWFAVSQSSPPSSPPAVIVSVDELGFHGKVSDLDLTIDNVVVQSNTVPEPSALVLLGSGAIGMFARAWQRWKRMTA